MWKGRVKIRIWVAGHKVLDSLELVLVGGEEFSRGGETSRTDTGLTSVFSFGTSVRGGAVEAITRPHVD